MAKYVTEEKFDFTMGETNALIHDLKDDLGVFRDEIMTSLDGITGKVTRLDQERVFTNEWIRRIESDISRIKGQLKIA